MQIKKFFIQRSKKISKIFFSSTRKKTENQNFSMDFIFFLIQQIFIGYISSMDFIIFLFQWKLFEILWKIFETKNFHFSNSNFLFLKLIQIPRIYLRLVDFFAFGTAGASFVAGRFCFCPYLASNTSAISVIRCSLRLRINASKFAISESRDPVACSKSFSNSFRSRSAY